VRNIGSKEIQFKAICRAWILEQIGKEVVKLTREMLMTAFGYCVVALTSSLGMALHWLQ
jgi:hypothetical protein